MNEGPEGVDKNRMDVNEPGDQPNEMLLDTLDVVSKRTGLGIACGFIRGSSAANFRVGGWSHWGLWW